MCGKFYKKYSNFITQTIYGFLMDFFGDSFRLKIKKKLIEKSKVIERSMMKT